MAERRKDNKGRVLKDGERQRKDGSYEYRWTLSNGKRKSAYAKTLDELRFTEEKINRDKSDGIRVDSRNVTVNDIYDLWKKLKKGLKDNTFQNYQYMYNQFVYPDFGKNKITKIKRTDVRHFYNTLAEQDNLKVSTIDSIHTVLHQVLELAVEDEYLRNNPSDNALRELKKSHNYDSEKRKALTIQEQNIFTAYLKRSETYHHWNSIFTVMLGTGLRVGEVTGLRWSDVDFENNVIDVNHTLVYYDKGNKCGYAINSPKTPNSKRLILMIESVRKAFEEEKRNQEENGIKCKSIIDGYTDFIFLNRFGNVVNHGILNKALRRIMRDCNEEILTNHKGKDEPVLLPKFSCHSLRHTFTTRMCESGMNVKVIQDVLGHSDISTTMNIYTDVTKELKAQAFDVLTDYLDANTISTINTPNIPQAYPEI